MAQEGDAKARRSARHHDEEFKRSVVEHWRSSGKTAATVAKEFGINVWNLRDWQRRYAPAPKAVDDPLPESPQEMKREIQQLRKELARAIHQREILKKTLGIISEV